MENIFFNNILMPRRIPDYPDAYSIWNEVSSFGSIISVFGVLVFILIIYRTFAIESIVNQSMWKIPAFFSSEDQINKYDIYSNTLEFSVDSPIPFHAYSAVPILTESVN